MCIFLLETFALQGKEKKCPFLGEVFRERGCYQFKASSNETVEMERTLLEMVGERLGLAHSRGGIPQGQEKELEGAWMGAEPAEEELGLHSSQP